ncbi:MAG: hypothetical protein K2Q27_05945 [Novosphingobium sp.]|uniref:hypothetical protein n=1 Tax=Novosphingobium sp. NDB2Meth1 TaxID=1892847 RepID=UPI000930B665|nr:hypothetical protein [Novosphingobium sp. NDB2Meth1]MBY0392789.1 hypothetical protein [Novosphingobium sp.]
MADNVIKEFLVGLGFKVDPKGQKAFTDGIDFATAKAVALGEALYDTAKAVAESVVKMAADFDQLYWKTQRLGSSAIDIKAFSYAMTQLGGSSQGAANALESIAEFTRSSPGATDFLVQWGVLPEHIGNAEKSLQDLAETFKRMPYWQAKSIATVIGVDPLTLQAMKRDTGEFEKWYRGMATRLGRRFGVDLNDTAEGANSAQTKLRELKAELELLVQVFLIKALPAINQFLGRFIEFLENLDHAKISTPEVVAALGAIAVAAAALSSPFIAAAAAIGAATVAYEGWLSKSPSKPGEPAKQGYENGWGIPGLFWFYNETEQEKKDRLAGNYSAIAKPVNRGMDPVGDPNNLMPDWMRGSANDNTRRSGGTRRRGGGTRAERNNNPGNIMDGSFARSQPGYAGSDGRFAIFDDVASGLNAMERLLKSYMARGRDTIAEIISKWAPPSENNVGAYVAHVEQLTGIGRFDQLQMTDLQRVAAAMAQHEGFRGLGVTGSGRSATVNQTNNYSIASNHDPKAIANEIASIQDSVNQRLVANFGVTVQ